jgi:ubiquinone/menaquinone biosynthesis C-methylase UbiE
MSDQETFNYKQQILNDFNARTNYDKADFKIRIAKRLISLVNLHSGQKVLDVATGTGLVALNAAKIVNHGQVIGVDISPGMLYQAKQKQLLEGLDNVKFLEADGENLAFDYSNFDIILCSLALCYLTDIPTALKQWYKFLKPSGVLAFNYWNETAFLQSILFRKVAKSYGIKIPHPNELLGTLEKCYKLLKEIGFQNVEVYAEQFGWYYTPNLDCAEENWKINSQNAFGFQILQLSPKELAQCKAEYLAEFQAIPTTEQGAWCDAEIFFVLARK